MIKAAYTFMCMTRYLKLIAFQLCLLFCSICNGQDFLNLGFEYTDANNQPIRWEFNPVSRNAKGYKYTVVKNLSTEGAHSLLMERDTLRTATFGICSISLPVTFQGKKIEIEGYIRSENVKNGWGGLWAAVDGETRNNVALNNMQQNGVTGTSGWQKYRITLPLTDFADAGEATTVHFGALLTGTGKIWVDNIKIYIDGIDLNKVSSKKINAIAVPQLKNIDWVKANMVEIKEIMPESSVDDLEKIEMHIGKSKFVALGEATHGTADFSFLKHKMIRFLVEKMGFSIIAFEAGMPQCDEINQYVLHGKGNPKTLLASLYEVWNTEEILDLIEWIKEYNKSHDKKVLFKGFDMQLMDSVIPSLANFIQTDSGTKSAMDTVRKYYISVLNLKANRDSSKLSEIEKAARRRYIYLSGKKKVDPQIVQYARLLLQSVSNYNFKKYSFRDSCMAENIQWLSQTIGQKQKMIIWSHNYHISRKKEQTMGYYLQKKFQNDYLVTVFTTNKGDFTGYNGKGFSRGNAIYPDIEGSVEAFLHKTDIPRFLIDLRQAQQDNGGDIFFKKMKMRSQGGVASGSDKQFLWVMPKTEFDMLIYLDTTHSSVALPDK
jgi:erythromycin esterase